MKISDIDVWVHASSLHKLMTGNFGLSETQSKKLKEYQQRKDGEFLSKSGKPLPLTDSMREEMEHLIEARDNPFIGETGRSYIREFITNSRFEYTEDVTNKQTEHGNMWEHHSIEMISTLIGKPLRKYEGKPFENKELILRGTPDVLTDKFVLDVKNPWGPKTFDAKMKLNDDGKFDMPTEYYWQLQAYMELCDVEVGFLVYTLNENQAMQWAGMDDFYSQFTLIDRMFVQRLERDRSAMDLYRERVPAIKREIDFQKEVIKLGYLKSVEYIEEIKQLIN